MRGIRRHFTVCFHPYLPIIALELGGSVNVLIGGKRIALAYFQGIGAAEFGFQSIVLKANPAFIVSQDQCGPAIHLVMCNSVYTPGRADVIKGQRL